ncbi:alpha/beta hydrolase [Kitasatospora aureofaciens]|uniref:alpha/beta hydrolase n=1 Tax=Kitasatospora aureofaciens TaxID=1894 RepID=UPI0027E07918|nr:alpha/beta hydrolase [Kitasatospora aureofaciens]
MDTNGFDSGYQDGEINFVLRAVRCNDSPAQRDFEAGWEHAQQLRARYPVGAMHASSDLCLDWPLRAQPAHLEKGSSALQLSGHAFETNTPMPWAKQMRDTIGGALLTVQNDVHSSLVHLPCAAKGVDFLVKGVATEGSCPGAPIPTPGQPSSGGR